MDKIKIFYDGLDFKQDKLIQGYTTNPTLLKKINKPFEESIKKFILQYPNFPLSVEVTNDDHSAIIEEANKISKWGYNIYIKIPIINTEGKSNLNVIQELLQYGININITCVFTKKQVDEINKLLTIKSTNKIIISIFAGRIADTGISPLVICKYTVELFKKYTNVEILWASTREIYNIFDAINCGCDIITIPEQIYQKIPLIGKDLNNYSKETVQQFIEDAKSL